MTRELDVACAVAVLRNLGTLVFRTRRARGVTRDRLAELTGVSLTVIKRLETQPGRLPSGRVALALLTWVDRPPPEEEA